jgi:energy-coupling factor transport system ATP-binding protein
VVPSLIGLFGELDPHVVVEGATPQAPLVDIRNVTFTYPNADKPALQDVSLTINEGEFVLLLGPTGGGKSTFTYLLSGAIPHVHPGDFEGEVLIRGKRTADTPMHEIATLVGAVFQEPEAQIINIFVKDELHFGPENLLVPADEIRRRAEEALRLVDMTEYAEREIFELSGGQMQKIALASVLTMQPTLLVLDQPTANLDPISARETFRSMRRLRDELGVSIVIIEHNVDDLATLVDRVAVFDGGRLVAFDAPRTIFYSLFADTSSSANERLGLWTPQAVELARELRGKVNLPGSPLSADELEPELRRHLDSGAAAFEPPSAQVAAAAPHAQPLVEVRGLSYTYESYDSQALNDVSLSIDPGEFLAIIGRNGSGKSTLAKILTKILEPPHGTVFVDGKDITSLSLFQLSDTIGYVFQNPDHQFVTDTVFDEVAYSLRVRHIAEEEVERRVDDILNLFHLKSHAKVSPFSLSVGERRLLSVATMLVLDQKMVILDEPTIGQDQAGADALMRHLRQLHDRGKAIVMITHDMRLLAEWSTRAVVMSRSKLLFDGSVKEIFGQPGLMAEASLNLPPVVQIARGLAGTPTGEPSPVLTPRDFALAWNARATSMDVRA